MTFEQLLETSVSELEQLSDTDLLKWLEEPLKLVPPVDIALIEEAERKEKEKSDRKKEEKKLLKQQQKEQFERENPHLVPVKRQPKPATTENKLTDIEKKKKMLEFMNSMMASNAKTLEAMQRLKEAQAKQKPVSQ